MISLCMFGIHDERQCWRFIKIGKKDGVEHYIKCQKCNKEKNNYNIMERNIQTLIDSIKGNLKIVRIVGGVLIIFGTILIISVSI